MTDRNLTTANPSDAAAIVSRHETSRPPGRHPVHVMARGSSTDIERRISQLTALAHGSEAEQAAYESIAMQNELKRLIALKAAGGKSLADHQPAPPAENEPARKPPVSVLEFPDLPDHKAFDHHDARQWSAALPALAAAGVTPAQAETLGKLLAKAAENAQRERHAEQKQAQAETQRRTAELLRTRHGSNWRQQAHAANIHLRNAMAPEDRGAQIGNWMLANGERLGDRPEFVSLLINLAEG